MSLLSAVVGVLDSAGNDVVPARLDGTKPLVKVQLGAGLGYTYTLSGDTGIITVVPDPSIVLTAPVTETRALGGSWIADPADWKLNPVVTALVNGTVGGAAYLYPSPADLPHASVTVSFVVRITGAAGHGAFPGGKPASMPTLALVALDTTTDSAAVLATATDASATAGAFEVIHSITLTTAQTINRSRYVYFLVLTAEHGANSIVGDAVAWTKVTRTRPAGSKLGQD